MQFTSHPPCARALLALALAPLALGRRRPLSSEPGPARPSGCWSGFPAGTFAVTSWPARWNGAPVQGPGPARGGGEPSRRGWQHRRGPRGQGHGWAHPGRDDQRQPHRLPRVLQPPRRPMTAAKDLVAHQPDRHRPPGAGRTGQCCGRQHRPNGSTRRTQQRRPNGATSLHPVWAPWAISAWRHVQGSHHHRTRTRALPRLPAASCDGHAAWAG